MRVEKVSIEVEMPESYFRRTNKNRNEKFREIELTIEKYTAYELDLSNYYRLPNFHLYLSEEGELIKFLRKRFLPVFQQFCQNSGHRFNRVDFNSVNILQTISRQKINLLSLFRVSEYYTQHFDFFREVFFKFMRAPEISYLLSSDIWKKTFLYCMVQAVDPKFEDWVLKNLKDPNFESVIRMRPNFEFEVYEQEVAPLGSFFPGRKKKKPVSVYAEDWHPKSEVFIRRIFGDGSSKNILPYVTGGIEN